MNLKTLLVKGTRNLNYTFPDSTQVISKTCKEMAPEGSRVVE